MTEQFDKVFAPGELNPADGLAGCIESSLVLGSAWDSGHPAIRAAIIPQWEGPSFSPIVLAGGSLPDDSVTSLVERRFEDAPITNSYLNPEPYLLVPGMDLDQAPRAYREAFKNLGWHVEDDPLSFNLLQPPKPLVVPERHTVTITDSGREGLAADYRALLGRSFGLGPGVLDRLSELFLRSDAVTLTLGVNDASGELVAAGSVSIRERYAMLTWGTVDQACRGRDIHRTLIGGCVSLAASYGADRCWLSTRNPRVRSKWDGSYELYIARRDTAP